jgi:hypothetical protein
MAIESGWAHICVISHVWVHYKTQIWLIVNIFFFDVQGFYLLTTIGVTHLEVNGTF